MPATRACRTCRKRRVWCDKALPSCQACVASCRSCGGYFDTKHTVFVNIDSSNISTKNKIRNTALKDALLDSSSVLPRHDDASRALGVTEKEELDFLSGSSFRSLSLDSLEMSPEQFKDHFSALWSYFSTNYQSTLDSYTVGFSQLMLRNKALDIALIALSTQRLAVSASDPKMQVMSWTAYHHSLRLYQHIVESTKRHIAPRSDLSSNSKRQSLSPTSIANATTPMLLFVISFVYTLFEGSSQSPSQIYTTSRSVSHLNGALAILRDQSPSMYSVDGYHTIFRKARELALHHALSARQATFLSEGKWMREPWNGRKKGWRDRLHDVGLRLTEVMNYVQGEKVDADDARSSERGTERKEDLGKRTRSTMAEKCREAWIELVNWREEWLRKAYPTFKVHCERACEGGSNKENFKDQGVCYCSISPAHFPDSDFAHLQVEQWSLLLLLGLLSRELRNEADASSSEAQLPDDETLARPNIVDDLESRVSSLAERIAKALHEPFYGQVLKDTPGITEGRCRSLFPLWVLTQYGNSLQATVESETTWWSVLGDRLNHGDEGFGVTFTDEMISVHQ